MRDMIAKGRKRWAVGSSQGSSKLAEQDVSRIRELADTHTYRELADRFGVTPTAIYKIVRRHRWRHLP